MTLIKLFQKVTLFGLSAFFVSAACAQSLVGKSDSLVQAQRAEDFVQSIGVNLHLGWWDTVGWNVVGGNWIATETKVQTELAFLGVTHVRDGVPSSNVGLELEALAATGVKFNLSQCTVCTANGLVNVAFDLTNIHTLEAAHPGTVETYEGANEYNINDLTLAGVVSRNNLAWGAYDDLAAREGLQGDSLLSSEGVKLVAASTASIPAGPVLPSGLVDYTNWHVYADDGEQLQDSMAAGIAAAQAMDPSKPVLITEAGSSSTLPSVSATYAAVGDVATQAVVDVNAVLDGYKDGAARTYLYQLMDQNAPDNDLYNNFGLFRADGTPKAAATSLHNLISILTDPGASTFHPSSLVVSLSGLPTTASSLLLQKSSGLHDLVVWNGNVAVRNGNVAVLPPTSIVSVDLGSMYAKVEVYDPMQSNIPIQTLSNVSSVALSLSLNPLIVQVNLNAPVVPTGISPAAWYNVVNTNSQSCLDAAGWSTGNGTHVLQWTCGQQHWNQEWQFQPTDSGYYTLRNRNAPDEVIDVNGEGVLDGSQVQLWSLWGGGNQQWLPVAVGNGFYKFIGRESKRCLDTPGASKTNGVQLQIYACNDTGAQRFLLAQQP